MCHISLIGANSGGLGGRKYYYILDIRQMNGIVLHFKDKNHPQKRINISQPLYQSLIKYILPRLQSIPSSNGRSYAGLELSVRCNGFEWKNMGSSGCVRVVSPLTPTKSQQKTYDEVITYLQTIVQQLIQTN